VYKGPEPMSEVEVQVMDRLNSKLRFQYAISYHSAGDEVLYPYLCGDMAEAPVYYSLMENLAAELGFGKRVASSSGEDFEHHYARYGTISFLLEVGPTFQPDYTYYETTVW